MKYLMMLTIAGLLFISGCTSLDSHVTEGGNQLKLRQIQTREYDGIDKEKTMRAVIATLQDLGFVIDKVDADLGSVSGTKLQKYTVKMTVIVREQVQNSTIVRANANLNDKPINDPEAYQNFFVDLDKSIFLLKNKVD